jgi:hypothetical protein
LDGETVGRWRDAGEHSTATSGLVGAAGVWAATRSRVDARYVTKTVRGGKREAQRELVGWDDIFAE